MKRLLSLLMTGCSAVERCGDLPTGKYSLVENVKTQSGARTMAVDPETHKVFLAAGEF